MPILPSILELIERFDRNEADYTSPDYPKFRS